MVGAGAVGSDGRCATYTGGDNNLKVNRDDWEYLTCLRDTCKDSSSATRFVDQKNEKRLMCYQLVNYCNNPDYGKEIRATCRETCGSCLPVHHTLHYRPLFSKQCARS